VGDSETQWLRERIAGFGDRPCLVRGDSAATYAELSAAVDCFDRELSHREAGTVILRSDYRLESVALLLALAGNGYAVAPMLESNTESIDRYAEACGADHVAVFKSGELCWSETAVVAATPPKLISDLRGRGRSGLILFSSGSTGQPKAMVHDFASFLAQYADRRPKRLAILLFLLFDHIGGLNTLFGSLASGMKMVAPASRNPDEVANLVESERVAVLPTTPTFLNLLLLSGVHDGRLRSLRVITYGAERMPDALLARLRKAFPRVRLIQTFGTSETGISKLAGAGDADNLLRLDPDAQEYKIVDGELWLRTKSQVLGYLNSDERRFTDDGWFRTGDLVEAMPDGALRIKNRVGELINVGGEKVFPSEVEAVIMELPEVASCTVYGVESPITGSTIAAEIVPVRPIDGAELRSLVRKHARKRLSRYKMPTKITVSDALKISARFKRETP